MVRVENGNGQTATGTIVERDNRKFYFEILVMKLDILGNIYVYIYNYIGRNIE